MDFFADQDQPRALRRLERGKALVAAPDIDTGKLEVIRPCRLPRTPFKDLQHILHGNRDVIPAAADNAATGRGAVSSVSQRAASMAATTRKPNHRKRGTHTHICRERAGISNMAII
jgi:hypothetical protein